MSLILIFPFPLLNILQSKRLFTYQLLDSFKPSYSKGNFLDGLNRTRLSKSTVDPFSLDWQIFACTADVLINCCMLKLPEYHQHKVETEEIRMVNQLPFSCVHLRFFYSCFHTHLNHLDPTCHATEYELFVCYEMHFFQEL